MGADVIAVAQRHEQAICRHLKAAGEAAPDVRYLAQASTWGTVVAAFSDGMLSSLWARAAPTPRWRGRESFVAALGAAVAQTARPDEPAYVDRDRVARVVDNDARFGPLFAAAGRYPHVWRQVTEGPVAVYGFGWQERFFPRLPDAYPVRGPGTEESPLREAR